MIATSEPHVSRPWKVKMDLKNEGNIPSGKRLHNY